jgi:hypothetical protein
MFLKRYSVVNLGKEWTVYASGGQQLGRYTNELDATRAAYLAFHTQHEDRAALMSVVGYAVLMLAVAAIGQAVRAWLGW